MVYYSKRSCDEVAMLPQLWMLSRIGGEVQGMTAHFVLAIMVSRICQTAFWSPGAASGDLGGQIHHVRFTRRTGIMCRFVRRLAHCFLRP